LVAAGIPEILRNSDIRGFDDGKYFNVGIFLNVGEAAIRGELG